MFYLLGFVNYTNLEIKTQSISFVGMTKLLNVGFDNSKLLYKINLLNFNRQVFCCLQNFSNYSISCFKTLILLKILTTGALITQQQQLLYRHYCALSSNQVLAHNLDQDQGIAKIFESHHLFCLYMTFKIRFTYFFLWFHTIEVTLKFSSYPKPKLYGGGGGIAMELPIQRTKA